MNIVGCDMVVSMRPYNNKEAIQSTIITSRYERVHGAPIHIGNPKAIGITKSLQEPDFGDPVTIQEVYYIQNLQVENLKIACFISFAKARYF